MEDIVIAAVIIQGMWTVAILVGSVAEALARRTRHIRYWTAPSPPAFPASVYDRQDAISDADAEGLPRAA